MLLMKYKWFSIKASYYRKFKLKAEWNQPIVTRSFHFFLISTVFTCCVLIHLVLRNQLVHIIFSLWKFHFIHSLCMVPVNEGFATEQRIELFADLFKHLLNSSWVPKEGRWHLDSLWRDVAEAGFYIIWDPLHEVWRVLVLHIQQLLVHLLHGHAAAEDGRHGQIAAVCGIAGGHHIFGIEHLLDKLWYSQRSEQLARSVRHGGGGWHTMQTDPN